MLFPGYNWLEETSDAVDFIAIISSPRGIPVLAPATIGT